MSDEPTSEASAVPQPDVPAAADWDQVESPSAPARNRGAQIAIGVVAVLLVAALAVPLLLRDGSTSSLRPLGITSMASAGDAMVGAAEMSIMPVYDVTYELAGPLPDLGSSGPVWQLTAPTVDVARVQELAAALGVSGEVVADGDGFRVESDERVVYVQRRSGGWWLSMSAMASSGGCASPGRAGGDVLVEEISPGVTITALANPEASGRGDVVEESDCVVDVMPAPADLPSEDEAVRLATSLIASLGVSGELQGEAMLAGMAVSDMACAQGEDCLPSPESFVSSRSVMVHSLVDGTRVEGLEWYVEIGDGGAVTSVHGILTDLELVGDYPLQTTQQAYDALAAGSTSGGSGFGGIEPALGAAEQPTSAVESWGDGDDAVSSDDPVGGPDVTIEPPGLLDPTGGLEPQVVTVTGATLVRQLAYGTGADGGEAAYVVPAYRFEGRLSWGGETSEWSTTVIAVTPELLGAPDEVPVVEPMPLPEPGMPMPSDPGPNPGPVPQPEPGTVPCKVQPDGREICEAPVGSGPVGGNEEIQCVTDPCESSGPSREVPDEPMP